MAHLVVDPHRPTPCTMHQFWEIDELVRLVATALEKHYTASASAVALARCSKRLGDIVLDSLWEQLTGLGLLLKCLPSDTWEVRDDEFVSTPCFGSLNLRVH